MSPSPEESTSPNSSTSPNPSTLPKAMAGIPTALHRSETELPFVELEPGVDVQLLQVDVESGLWVVRVRFQPGVRLQRHKHTGEVFAVTFSGSWKYIEYPDVNTAGSYLFEPASSVHTLYVPESNEGITDVWFAIRGANLNLDDNDQVESVLDAQAIKEFYLQKCRESGLEQPPVIGLVY
jgi:2,4'-dihydroxyacetophenone dioxygenase